VRVWQKVLVKKKKTKQKKVGNAEIVQLYYRQW